jgi:ankyrin repeat protein
MLLSWLWAATAQASPLCDALLQPTPPLAALQQALAAGDDPNEPCRWTARVPSIQTRDGVLAALFAPVVSWPLLLTEQVQQERSALPLSLAIDDLGDEGVAMLLDAGARPYDGALETAVRHDRWEVARWLVEAGAPPTLQWLGEPLAGDRERLAKLDALGIRLDPVTALAGGGAMLTDPIAAARFLEQGLAPEVLMLPVVEHGSVAVFELCLAASDATDSRLVGALRSAVIGRRWDLADRLRAFGVPWDADGQSPVLVEAVSRGSALDVVTWLLNAGAPVDDTESWGASALSIAARDGRAELVSLLLARGASPGTGHPLVAALWSDETAIAEQLLAAGAPVDDATVRSVVDHPGAIGFLLGHGLSADHRLGTGQTLAVLAVRNKKTEVLRMLVDAGAPLDGPTPERSALRAAIATDDPALVELVLALGADPGAMPLEGVWRGVDGPMEAVLLGRLPLAPSPDALVDAVRRSDVARVQHLLSAGADPNAPDRWDDLPLDLTTDAEIERLLLAAGARLSYGIVERLVRDGAWSSLERRGVQGTALGSLLTGTVERGDSEGVAWMLAHGADPNQVDIVHFRRPLSAAIERRDLALVELLLAAGASVTRTDGKGATVIHQAVEDAFPEAIGPLHAAGAPLDLPDDEGRMPIQRALERWNPTAVDALLAAGHPYAPLVLAWDLETCQTDRLKAHVLPGSLSWTTVRPQVRGRSCRAELRRWLRDG